MAINWVNKCNIEFGNGNIQVASLHSPIEKKVAVGFGELANSYPIGSEPPRSDANYGNLTVGLFFDKTESIDAVIRVLNVAREALIKMLEDKDA